MVITGNNRNSASPWPNPLLSLSLARSSLLHLHSPFSIQFFLSSLLFSSSSYLFFSSSSSLSLTPLSQSEESTTAQCASSYCHAVGQSREERGLIVFFSFSLHFLFPSRPPCPLLFRPLIKSKFSSNLASSLSPSPSSLLAHGLAIPSSSAVPSTSSDHRSSDQLLLPLPSPISPV